MNENNVLAVILAGGKSKRFGRDKANVMLGDKTILEHVIDKIQKIYSEILVISNNDKLKFSKKNIFIASDCIKGHLGPLVGVLSAMKWVKQNNRKYNWISTFPCDTPFFDEKIIEELEKKLNKTQKQLVFLKSGERRHNIFGLWSLNLMNVLEEDIKNNFRKVEDWANKIGSDIINIESNNFDNFLNINTEEDYKNAKKNLEKIKNDFV